MSSLCRGLRSLLISTNIKQTTNLSNGFSLHPTCVARSPNAAHLMSPLARCLHVTSYSCKNFIPNEPKNWPRYNEIVYPPTPEGEPVRPAEVVHHWANVKYSQKKLWYICFMIRGMSVDEAKKQLSFVQRKGGAILKEIIEEAQDLAVKEHNVEFKSNLWISDCFTVKARTVKGVKKGGRGRYSTLNFRYCHIMLRLREGTPPKHYYTPNEKTGHQHMEDYIQEMRNRTIRKML